jgi:transaldolase
MNSRLHDLSRVEGQSAWLDNLQRSYLTQGILKNLITQGVRGLTSNPSIFQKAIQGSVDYDAQFSALIAQGCSPIDAYWEMVIEDINGALDAFEALHKESDGTDGFVSVEVDPSLAHNSEQTLIAARALEHRINRPNVMIKIPATNEGLPAIEQMIADGCNVNVTLIFSLGRYQDVMDAYIAGLTKRAHAGLALTSIASVASFFISRVDNEVDARLRSIGSPLALSLLGTTAVNQARLAYQLFETTFSGEHWESLVQKGARVQRPLWASTSTKDPSYSDTLYVDELIGPHTVNTLPDATLEAFINHGTVLRTIDKAIDVSHSQWQQLKDVGIDMTDVSEKLENEGVQSFMSSFDALINALSEKVQHS